MHPCNHATMHPCMHACMHACINHYTPTYLHDTYIPTYIPYIETVSLSVSQAVRQIYRQRQTHSYHKASWGKIYMCPSCAVSTGNQLKTTSQNMYVGLHWSPSSAWLRHSPVYSVHTIIQHIHIHIYIYMNQQGIFQQHLQSNIDCWCLYTYNMCK